MKQDPGFAPSGAGARGHGSACAAAAFPAAAGVPAPSVRPLADPPVLRRVAGWRAALLVSALGLAACGGGGGGGTTPPEPPVSDGTAGRLSAVSRPGELAGYVQQRLRTQVSQGRLQSLVDIGGGLGWMPPTFAAAPAAGAATGGDASAAAELPRSATLVQEEGVAEADRLASHGELIYSLSAGRGGAPGVQVHRRQADGSLQWLRRDALSGDGADSLTGTEASGLYLSEGGGALAVVSQAWDAVTLSVPCLEVCTTPVPPRWYSSSVQVQWLAAGEPRLAVVGDTLRIQGHLVDSRRIGDRLYLVTTHTPQLDVQSLPGDASPAQREAAIAAVTAQQVLPQLRRNGGAPRPLLADTDCWVQTGNASTTVALTTVTVLDLRDPTMAPRSRCFVGGSEALYMSPSHLYLATTRIDYTPDSGAKIAAYPSQMRTDIHKFSLTAEGVAYRASGVVDGHLGWDSTRKPYRFSEHNGDLRVLTFTGREGWFLSQDREGKTPSPATLSVLREDSATQTLKLLATLPNSSRPAALGKPGEQVYGVRFVGDRGYVVTFQRTDPLYALDLSNPADPRVLGELEIAGFSEQLFPLPGGLLLGVGRDADAQGVVTGLKVALFDVADGARMRQIHSITLGGPTSSSALDESRHGLNLMLKDGVARIALPVALGPAGPWGPGAEWQTGLQRFAVDTAARSLAALSMLGAATSPWRADLGQERSLQIGDHVYHLTGNGELRAYAW